MDVWSLKILKEKLRFLDASEFILDLAEAELFDLSAADRLSVEDILLESEDGDGY